MWINFISWDWAAPVFAVLWLMTIGAIGWWVWSREKSALRLTGMIGTGFGAALGILMLVGAIAYQLGYRSEMATVERPGLLVDVGGYNIHVACAGETKKNTPTIIWISGGHSAGLNMNHLHRAWQPKGRSCFLDRAGTGWSDPGPEPRSIKAIVTEFDTALKGAGETGPFVIVGHSMGGLLGVNWAARNRNDIVGLIALDPTPQEMIQTGGVQYGIGWCGAAKPGPQMTLSAFGLGHLLPGLHPMNSAFYRDLHQELEDEILAIKAMESRPRAILEGYKSSKHTCYSGYQTVRHPGALGDLPILSIVQQLQLDEDARAMAEQWSGVSDDFEWDVFKRSSQAASQEYPGFSSQGTLVFLPGDWGHNFPLTHPDYVIDQVETFVARYRVDSDAAIGAEAISEADPQDTTPEAAQ